MITKPMLADTCEDMTTLPLPVLATPKLDGFRCLKIDGRALTRAFKPVPNRYIREWIEANLPDGVDGEIIVKGATFSETAGHIARETGQPDFTYVIFDYVRDSLRTPYADRIIAMRDLPLHRHIERLFPILITSLPQLQAYETICVRDQYEGVMVRSPASPYKCGRSTVREGFLLKIKRWQDSEAIVTGTYEGMTNQNEAERDAFGRTKRSSAQAGMIGRGELGGFNVRMSDGIEFDLGYNHVIGGVDRITAWHHRQTFIGRYVKFKHQPSGAKEKPRFPKFAGFREAWDMDAA